MQIGTTRRVDPRFRHRTSAPSRASFRAKALFRIAGVMAVVLLSLGVASCGSKPPEENLLPKESTWAELRAVRHGVHVQHHGDAERDPYAHERLTDGAVVRIEDGGLAWLRRDGGSTLLARGPAKLTLKKDTLDIQEGRVFAESPQGIVTALGTPAGALYLSDVRASVDVKDGRAEVYVLEGEVRTKTGEVAKSGELLRLEKDKATVSAALVWEDWTGGLATTDRSASPPPFGIGTVGARTPGATGAPRSPLTIQRLDVRVSIEGDFATTEVDETFFNPVSTTVEGIYQFRAPEGAILERFGVDRLDGIAWGYVKEKKAAAAQYQANVYQGSTEDPALLEWRAPGVYQARLYPIGPGATRRVVVRYTEWLGRSGAKGERRLYVFPMAAEGSEESLPHVEELTAEVDVTNAEAGEVRAGMQAVRSGDVIAIREHDFVPRADLAIELYDPTEAQAAGKPKKDPDEIVAFRAPHAPDLTALPPNEREAARKKKSSEADYILVPLRGKAGPAAAARKTGGLDLLVVVDSSAATDGASLSLARAATRSLLAHLGKEDRVAVFTGDDSLRPLVAGQDALRAADDSAKAEILSALSKVEQGGATDLGAMLSDAIAKLPNDADATKARASAIVYIGDGSPTVGELSLADLRAKLAKAPRPARIFALGIGEDANMGVLAGLSNGAFAERIGDEHAAAQAALRLLEVADAPVDLGVKVSLGANVERIYPRDLSTIAEDQTTLVVGRLTGPNPPTEIAVTTSRGEQKMKIKVTTFDDHGDLRRRWAMGRLDEMLAEGGGHAALVDLGVRQGIITPVTSLYVPTTAEMTADDRANIDRTIRERRGRPTADRGGKDVDEKQKAKVHSQGDDDTANKKDEGFLDGLMGRKSDSSPAANEDHEQDQKEGGTGTRAKGEEGRMASPLSKTGDTTVATPTAAATAAAEAPPPAARPTDAPTLEPPAQNAATPPGVKDAEKEEAKRPMHQAAEPTVAPGPQKNLEMRNPSPDAKPEPGAALAVGSGGGGRGAGLGGLAGKLDPNGTARPSGGECNPNDPLCGGDLADKRINRDDALQEASEFGMIGMLDGDKGFDSSGTRIVIIVGDNPGRHIRLCGDASKLPFEERRALWRERLGQSGGSPQGAVSVYRQALAQCEAPTPRERTALLLMMLDFIPATSQRVQLWRLMATDLGAADVLYRGILSRVTTPAQMRELSSALGLMTVEPSVLEKALKDAKDPADKVAKLRALVALFPNDLNLALILLDAIEDAGDASGARSFSRQLRTRADAEARVRTSVGELFLRLSDRDTDATQKDADALEARRAFGEIVEFCPDDPVARRRLGDLLRAHGFYAEASRQYETLAKLTPDDPSVSLLLAACAEGLGRLEEAVRWTEKGGSAGAPDVAQGPFATARAFAATYLAWGKLEARKTNDTKTLEALSARLARVLSSAGQPPREGQVRVSLTWSHPEFHPTLWSNALGAPMPAPEGDVTLGIAQVMLPDHPGGVVEVRVDPQDLDRAARLGAKGQLTIIFGENQESEIVLRKEVGFTKAGPSTLRFKVESGHVDDLGGGK